jgi:hypothetical protein
LFKVAFFLWRRTDFDRDRFIDYYENRHAVLSHQLIPQPLDFRRNYPVWGQDLLSRSRPGVFGMEPFDVMTELFHADRSSFAAQVTTVTKSPARELMAEDELNFLNRNRQVLLVFDEFGGSGALSFAGAAAKLIRFVRRSSELSAGQFRDAYESDAAPLLAHAIPKAVEYRRSYPLFDDPASYAGNWHIQGRPDSSMFPLDLFEEFWLADSADIALVGELLSKPVPLVDTNTTHTVRVDELRSGQGTRMAPVAGRSASAEM